MKKSAFIILGLAASFAFTGCKTSPNASGADSTIDSTAADSSATETAALDTMAVDSVVYRAHRDSTVSCIIRVDYPKTNDSLALGVKTMIANTLAQTYLPVNNDPDGKKSYPTYKGSKLNPQRMIDHYGTGTLRYLLAEKAEATADRGEEASDPVYVSMEMNVSKGKEQERYVDYQVSQSTYLGGAHGSFTSFGITVSKLTNKALTSVIDKKYTKALQPLLRKGARQYFKEMGEPVTDAKLNEQLILPDDGLIPLPAFTPYLDANGVNFIYQQYEIACYAVGLVSFTIPYKDIEKYLTPEAKALIAE